MLPWPQLLGDMADVSSGPATSQGRKVEDNTDSGPSPLQSGQKGSGGPRKSWEKLEEGAGSTCRPVVRRVWEQREISRAQSLPSLQIEEARRVDHLWSEPELGRSPMDSPTSDDSWATPSLGPKGGPAPSQMEMFSVDLSAVEHSVGPNVGVD
jgi:hypothetical protein